MIVLETDIDFTVTWPLIIEALVSVILPLLVGLVTKKTTKSGTKAVLLAALAVLSSGLTELLASMNAEEIFDLGTWLVGAVVSFAIAVSFHYGIWKPVGASATLQAVGDKAKPPEAVNGSQTGT